MPSRGISNWHYVYVVLSKKDNDFYIGYTQNLEKRIQEHNAKKPRRTAKLSTRQSSRELRSSTGNFSTKSRLPLKLIYAEECLNKDDAQRREDYLKTSQNRRFLKLRLRKFLENLS